MTFTKVSLVASAFALALVSIVAAPVQAAPSDEGLAGMHDLRRERGYLCFSDHFHYGTSAGQKSKRSAELEAIASWSDFVSFEYGSAWMSYKKSGSKSMECSQAVGGWACDVSARPCR